MKAGDFVKIDFGAEVGGYHSDMTRTFVLGSAAQWQLDLYDLVRVQHAATGTNQLLRVVQVVHEITPRKWLARFRFAVPFSPR